MDSANRRNLIAKGTGIPTLGQTLKEQALNWSERITHDPGICEGRAYVPSSLTRILAGGLACTVACFRDQTAR